MNQPIEVTHAISRIAECELTESFAQIIQRLRALQLARTAAVPAEDPATSARSVFIDRISCKTIHNSLEGFGRVHFRQFHLSNKVMQRPLNIKGNKHDVQAN